MLDRYRSALLALLVAALPWAGCSPDTGSRVVRVASTTSLYDTGLLDELVEAFGAEHPGYAVRVVAVGTGQALSLGERGDADLLFVHAPERERAFVAAGHGRRRTTLMVNEFVIAGPGDDPAAIAGAADAPDALRTILAAGVPFASRGDESGTHIRERAIWEVAGVQPEWPGYMEVGQGMGSTLMIADERGAYVLTDRATLTVLRHNGLDLVELYSDGPDLENEYSIIPVAGAAEPAGADAFEAWMRSAVASRIIREFGRDQFGHPLFQLVSE